MAKTKKKRIKLLIEFFKYNMAGGAFFWSTYLLFFVFDTLFGWPEAWALAVASIAGHIIYFTLDESWVFSADRKRRKSKNEFTRFAIFMTFNYFLNLGIVLGLSELGITPYIGQFIASFFFTFWNFVGFKIWVFKPSKAERKRAQHVRSRRAPTKQKATRTA